MEAPLLSLAILAEFIDKLDWFILLIDIKYQVIVLEYPIIMNNHCHLLIMLSRIPMIMSFIFFFSVNFDHFQILRAIGKGSFGKVANLNVVSWHRFRDTKMLNERKHAKHQYINEKPKINKILIILHVEQLGGKGFHKLQSFNVLNVQILKNYMHMYIIFTHKNV